MVSFMYKYISSIQVKLNFQQVQKNVSYLFELLTSSSRMSMAIVHDIKKMHVAIVKCILIFCTNTKQKQKIIR